MSTTDLNVSVESQKRIFHIWGPNAQYPCTLTFPGKADECRESSIHGTIKSPNYLGDKTYPCQITFYRTPSGLWAKVKVTLE